MAPIYQKVKSYEDTDFFCMLNFNLAHLDKNTGYEI